jgi:inosine/xanthosine triphosphatase
MKPTFIDELQDIPACVYVTKIAIGSMNPVKIKAVKNAFNDVEAQIVSCSALSDVRSQPLSNEETLQGAINRARDCLKKTDAGLAIGLEAGVVVLEDEVYLCHWGAIVDRNQNTYFTNGPLILLPTEYLKPLLEGQNLEDIMHHSTGIESLGAKEGAIGVFTQNRLNREQVLTQMVKALLGQYHYYQPAIQIKGF